MANSFPSRQNWPILQKKAEPISRGAADKLEVTVPALHRYVAEREELLDELKRRHAVDRGTAKKVVLRTINFGGYRRTLEECGGLEPKDDDGDSLVYSDTNRTARTGQPLFLSFPNMKKCQIW